MSHSTREFVLSEDWIDRFTTACADQGPLFGRIDNSAPFSEGTDPISFLLRSAGAGPESVIKQLQTSFGMNESSIIGYVEQLNRCVGMHFKHRFGYRDHPLLVLSKHHPWASFFSPISNAKSYLRSQMSELLSRRRSLHIDVLVGAIATLLIVCHPFVDCNGRTTRLVLFSMLTRHIGLNAESAIHYANLFSGSSEPFVLSFWEVRENRKFDGVVRLFK